MHIVICGENHGPVSAMIVKKLSLFTMTVFDTESITDQKQIPEDADLLVYLHNGAPSSIPRWVDEYIRSAKLIYSSNSAKLDEISDTIDMILMGKN